MKKTEIDLGMQKKVICGIRPSDMIFVASKHLQHDPVSFILPTTEDKTPCAECAGKCQKFLASQEVPDTDATEGWYVQVDKVTDGILTVFPLSPKRETS